MVLGLFVENQLITPCSEWQQNVFILQKKKSESWNRSEEMQSDDMFIEKGCNFIIHANLYAYIFFVLECHVTGDVMKLNLLASGIFVVCFLFKNPQH